MTQCGKFGVQCSVVCGVMCHVFWYSICCVACGMLCVVALCFVVWPYVLWCGTYDMIFHESLAIHYDIIALNLYV